jgi:uncharacterized protein involved in type VI secretion and phage assembly
MPEQLTGVAIARVTNNRDDSGQGRIEVMFPWLGEDSPRRWCSVAAPAAGGTRGLFFPPEIDDEVLVAADQGDFDHVYILGYLWNPVQPAPSSSPHSWRMVSPSGHMIQFVNGDGSDGNQGALVISDAHGNAITMTNAVMTIQCVGHLSINGTTLTLNGRPVGIGGPL